MNTLIKLIAIAAFALGFIYSAIYNEMAHTNSNHNPDSNNNQDIG